MVPLVRGAVSYERGTPAKVHGLREALQGYSVQGYLAHAKKPTPQGPPRTLGIGLL
jgi:hypothetical protein